MTHYALHHVSLTTHDLPRSIAFFTDVLGFERVARPEFPIAGCWLRAGAAEVHLIDFAEGSFRNTPVVGTDDVHVALRVDDFDATVQKLNRHGYREDLETNDNKRIIVKKKSMAGYSQLYVMTPENHLIEINSPYS